jgi:hypothetical protein
MVNRFQLLRRGFDSKGKSLLSQSVLLLIFCAKIKMRSSVDIIYFQIVSVTAIHLFTIHCPLLLRGFGGCE